MMGVPSDTWFTAPPHWGWLIVLYLFFGGLAGGCYFLAALLDLFGRPEDRALARRGYYVAMATLAISAVLLIADLQRPLRFWHLLVEIHTWQPMLKPWSPIAIGSWALLAFGLFVFLSFFGALAESERVNWPRARRLRPPGNAGAVLAVIGALLALYIAGYSGVMLTVTNRPIWADTPLLGMLLLVSSASISAACMMLLSRPNAPGVLALQRFDRYVIAVELVVLIALVVSLGSVARAWLNAWGLLLLVGVLIGGMLLPLALHGRNDWLAGRSMSAAAVLVLAGGFILRIVIVFSSEGIHP
jgi:protein NrfD